MPRKLTLRKKNVSKSVSWFTKAGGDTSFGNVQDVSCDDARRFFAVHIKSLVEEEVASKRKVLTADELGGRHGL